MLAIGAHPDDIELGCGGTLLAHSLRGDAVAMLVMTTGESGPQASRSRIHEQEDAAELLRATLFWGGFQDGAVAEGRAAVDAIESVLRQVQADVVYTHTQRDTHQDHRATSVATLAAARRFSRILMYEAPTTQEFEASVYVDIAGLVEPKVNLLRAHVSQVLKNGLVDLEAVEAQARYRGFQARIRQAEAFETERFLWDLSVPAEGPDSLDLMLEEQAGSIASV